MKQAILTLLALAVLVILSHVVAFEIGRYVQRSMRESIQTAMPDVQDFEGNLEKFNYTSG